MDIRVLNVIYDTRGVVELPIQHEQRDHNPSAISHVKHSGAHFKWFKVYAVGSVRCIYQRRSIKAVRVLYRHDYSALWA